MVPHAVGAYSRPMLMSPGPPYELCGTSCSSNPCRAEREARRCSGVGGGMREMNRGVRVGCRLGIVFFFFFTLVTGPRRSLSLKLSDTRVYEPHDVVQAVIGGACER